MNASPPASEPAPQRAQSRSALPVLSRMRASDGGWLRGDLLAGIRLPGYLLPAARLADLQSAHALGGLADELKAEGIRLQALEARVSVRERFRAEGFDARFGGINRFTSIAAVVDNLKTAEPMSQS